MSIKLFLFDLDGTIVDSAPALGNAVNAVRARENLPAISAEILRPLAGRGAPGLIGDTFHLNLDDPEYLRLRQAFFDHYRANITDGAVLFPGIENLLKKLHTLNIKTGIVTNKATDLARILINDMGYSQYFDVILGFDGPGCRMKPAPDSLLAATRALGILPGQTLYAGDDKRDVDAAHAADIACAGVSWGYSPTDPSRWNADFIAHHPDELLKWASHYCAS